MAKVGIQLSFTFRIGDEKLNQFAKIAIDISDVDTDLPLTPQLGKTADAIDNVWAQIRKKADDKIESILGEVK